MLNIFDGSLGELGMLPMWAFEHWELGKTEIMGPMCPTIKKFNSRINKFIKFNNTKMYTKLFFASYLILWVGILMTTSTTQSLLCQINCVTSKNQSEIFTKQYSMKTINKNSWQISIITTKIIKNHIMLHLGSESWRTSS